MNELNKSINVNSKTVRIVNVFFALIIFVCVLTVNFAGKNAYGEDNENGNRKIKVGYYIAPGFQDYDKETGEYSGTSYEYMLAVKQYVNWDYEFVPVTFSEGIEKLKNGEIDLMNNVSITSEREEYFEFSQYASGSNYACLVVDSEDTKYAYNDFEAFNNMTVGLLNTSIFNQEFSEFCEKNNFNPKKKYYENDDEIVKAMNAGEIDARILTSSYNMGYRVVTKFSPKSYYFAVTKNNSEIMNELNYAMECINTEQPGLLKTLENKYYGKHIETNVVLTENEKKYLAEKPVVKVACTKTWYPISYFDKNGKYSGPLSKVYEWIGEKTGITFEYIPYDNYSMALQAFNKGVTDMICEMPIDYIFAEKYGANLSDGVTSIGIYKVTKSGKDANKIKSVAVLEDTYIGHKVMEMYDENDITIYTYKTTQECVKAVNSGKVDCTFVNVYQAGYYQSKGKYLNLKYALIPELQYNMCLASHNNADGAILKSIISKGLATLEIEKIEEMFQSAESEDSSQDLELFFYRNPILVMGISIIIAISLVVAILFTAYSRRLKKKNNELIVAKQQESSFLSRMSHDIRTPLNGIIGMTRLAREDAQTVEQYRQYFEKIESSGEYLKELVNNILDFKKIESETMELRYENYVLRDLERHVNAVIMPLCEEKSIKFIDELMDGKGAIKTDKVRLNQILINLLSNAVKYTPAGGTVKMYSEKTNVQNGVMSTEIIIEDNGIGMSEEFQAHMFDTFSQENTTTAAAGSGLGLAIVKMLVEKMNGKIIVKSTAGQGTKVTLQMKFNYYENVESDRIQTELSDNCFEGVNVLMCEDHAMNAEIAKRLLEKKQARVTLAKNGAEGVKMFKISRKGYFDIILMDVRMPVMGGIEATRCIRMMERDDAKKIPIVAMTADAYDTDRERTKEAGMNEHLSKPIDADEMYQTMYKLLN